MSATIRRWRAVRRATAAGLGLSLVAAAIGLVPAGTVRAAVPALGAWHPDGPTRTIMDAVTALGAGETALISQSADGVRRSADGGRTWSEPAGLPARDPRGGASSSSLAVLASDRDRAWLAISGTPAAAPHEGPVGAAPRVDEADEGAGDPGDAGANEFAGPVLLASADAGATWTPVPGDGLAGRIVFDLAAVPVASGDPVILAADATAGILRSDDGGRTFVPAVRGVEPDPEVGGIVVGGLAAGIARGVAFASTTSAIWRTVDAGLTWEAACVTSGTLPCGRPYVAPGDPTLVLGAGFGGVVRSPDGGRTWARVGTTALPGPDDGGIDSIALSADATPVAWASGPRGVFRSADGGVGWEPWDGGIGGPGVSASDRLAIDPDSRARGWRIHGLSFFTTVDGGLTWTELAGPDPVGVAAYAALADGRGTRIVGTADGIAVRTDRRWATTRADAIAMDLARGRPTDAARVRGDGDGVVYAATYASGVLRSEDGGLAWESWSRGLPRVPAWAILAPVAGGDRVLLATDAGAFERASDAPSWARLGMGLPDAAVRTLAQAPDGSILAGLETRGVWRQPRGVDEWLPAGLDGRTILSLAVASADGRVLLAATDRRGLWRSSDAGRTWRRVASTRATASVAWDPETRVAVLATGAGALASSDGGRTWRTFAAGLPALDPDRPWARSTTSVRPLAGGGFALTTLAGTYLARPEGSP
jgi:hypothetical protein